MNSLRIATLATITAAAVLTIPAVIADPAAKPAGAPAATIADSPAKAAAAPAATHPDSTKWEPLFSADLSNADFKAGIWTVTDGVMTASEDEAIYSKVDYENFTLDLEFKTADGTNSGVVVHATDTKNWIPNSVEIQIADDFSTKWSKQPRTWQCAAIFGRLAAVESVVKKPGEWNRMTVTCSGKHITVALNSKLVTDMDMAKWTSAKKNPDGTDIPSWLNRPLAEMATKGRVGLQGKHADALVWFRNVKIKPDAAK